MTRTDRAFQWLGYISSGALILMAAWLFFLEKPPLQYPVQPFPVLSLKVFPGDALVMTVRRISAEPDETSYTVARWLVNVDTGERVVLKPSTTSVTPGDHTVANTNVVVPSDFLVEHEPGRYYAAGNVSVDGAVRSFKVVWRSSEFEVIRPGDDR